MQAGDIIFVKGRTPMSALIRLFDPGEFSHVAMAVSKTHILEAQYGTRTRIVPFRFKMEDCKIIDLGLPPKDRRTIETNSIYYVGKKYDYLQAIYLGFKKGYDNTNNMICTEVIHELLKESGYMCCPHDMTPNELYRFFKKKLMEIV